MILMAGQKIDCQTAQNWGLIDNMTTPGGLMDHAHNLVAGALTTPLTRLSTIKSLIRM